jgi:hypothetical protein
MSGECSEVEWPNEQYDTNSQRLFAGIDIAQDFAAVAIKDYLRVLAAIFGMGRI